MVTLGGECLNSVMSRLFKRPNGKLKFRVFICRRFQSVSLCIILLIILYYFIFMCTRLDNKYIADNTQPFNSISNFVIRTCDRKTL